MMRTNFDELIRITDGDGASVGGRLPGGPPEVDARDMLRAWSIERHRAVEAELVLEEALCFLKRKVRSNRMLSDSDRREAQELIRTIRSLLDQQG